MMAACDNDVPEDTTADVADAPPTQVVTDDDSVTANGLTVNPVGTFPIVNERVTLSAYFSTWEDLDVDNNEVLEWFEEKTNVRIDAIMETDPEMRILMLVSGDYPDIFAVNFSMLDVENFGTRQQIFIPLNDLIEEYSEIVRERINNDPRYRISATASDGNIYGLPRFTEEVFSHPMAPGKFWINSHWLDTLGLDMPTTTDEFRDVMLAFRYDDPNDTGIQDVVPMSGAINTARGELENFIMNAFIYTDRNHFLYNNNGTIEFVATAPEFRQGLEFMHDLFQAGLIDPAAFTQDLSQLTRLGTDEVGILGGFSGLHVAMGIDISDRDRHSQFIWLPPLRGPGGVQYAIYGGTDGFSNNINVAITDRVEQPEIAMRVVDFMFSDIVQMRTLGLEGIAWDWVDDESLFDMYGNPARVILHDVYVADALRADRVVDRFPPLALSATLWGRQVADIYGDIFIPENYEIYLARATLDYAPFFPEHNILPLNFPQDISDELATLTVNIVTHVQQAMTRFIVGDMDLATEWDSFVAGLENLNVARYIEIHQEGHDRLQEMLAALD